MLRFGGSGPHGAGGRQMLVLRVVFWERHGCEESLYFELFMTVQSEVMLQALPAI